MGLAMFFWLVIWVMAVHSLADCFQGNCEDVDAVAALGLEPDVAANLLPLKPHQCLLIIHESLLMVSDGNIWLDNLYVKLTRQVPATTLSIITSVGHSVYGTTVYTPVRFYATNITFHSSYGRDAAAVGSAEGGFLMLFDGAPLHGACAGTTLCVKTPQQSVLASGALESGCCFCTGTLNRLFAKHSFEYQEGWVTVRCSGEQEAEQQWPEHPKVSDGADVSMHIAPISLEAVVLALPWCIFLLSLHAIPWAYLVLHLPWRGQGLNNCLRVWSL